MSRRNVPLKTADTAPVRLCDWDRLDAVASDQMPPATVAADLHRHGVELILPEG